MDTYYNPEDLAKFGTIGEKAPELAEKFFSYYNAVFEEGALTGVTETHNIFKTADGAEARNDNKVEKLDVKSLVSMNMWGLTPVFMETLEKGFVDFLSELKEGDIKKEYLLPEMIDRLIKEGKAKVDVLETKDTWFGVTYQEDKATVTEAFANLVKSGVYPSNLYK